MTTSTNHTCQIMKHKH